MSPQITPKHAQHPVNDVTCHLRHVRVPNPGGATRHKETGVTETQRNQSRKRPIDEINRAKGAKDVKLFRKLMQNVTSLRSQSTPETADFCSWMCVGNKNNVEILSNYRFND